MSHGTIPTKILALPKDYNLKKGVIEDVKLPLNLTLGEPLASSIIVKFEPKGLSQGFLNNILLKAVIIVLVWLFCSLK